MLRPTESPIVFIQQLGRGLRKAEGKEFVVILDFIGNYNNNFMIPVALSGDRSYNQDTIRKYVISGNSTIPGASTVHFDEIAKNKISAPIDKMKGMRSIIRESYISLKNRLGRVPYLLDFYKSGQVDPLVIIREYKTYQTFLESVEKDTYMGKISEQELLILEYLSKTILSGVRPYELEILNRVLSSEIIYVDNIKKEFKEKYGYSNKAEYERFRDVDFVRLDETQTSDRIYRLQRFSENLENMEFRKQLQDVVDVGLSRYRDKYSVEQVEKSTFVLYEKYSRRDVSFLMDCGKDLSSTMYGMKKINDDVFIFVTYHKEESKENDKKYIDGKPDYADAFEDNMIFRWDSQMGKGIGSSYVKSVVQATRRHLLIKKSDAETNFYYMGQFDILTVRPAKKVDNNGKERDIAKFKVKLHHAVREDLLRYLQSSIRNEETKPI